MKMKKPMKMMLIGVAILFGFIFIYKVVAHLFLKKYLTTLQHPVVYVSAAKADYEIWKGEIKASASLRAIYGVNVTTQLSGMVREIYFKPGDLVKKGALLVQLNADSEIAQLHSLQANAELAKVTYDRDKAQYAVKAVSKATLDADAANLKSAIARVEEQVATVDKLTIRAPFDGRLGISAVNPGQFLNPGSAIVPLQTLNPIYADFYLPQQELSRLKIGQVVQITSDAFPGKVFLGKLTTINPAVETSTRNVEVEAVIANPNYELAPGMFATAIVKLGTQQSLLTVPVTAVSFNPYGDIIYVLKRSKEKKKDADGKEILIAHQFFVTVGEQRGDQIVILKGAKKGEYVVTGGQLKLKNGSEVVINNTLAPNGSANLVMKAVE